MSETRRLVERLDKHTATAVICDDCGWRGRDNDPASGDVSEGYMRCPKCSASVDYEYDEGIRCAGCLKMDVHQPLVDEHGHYCSRRCQLQAEYARSLKATA